MLRVYNTWGSNNVCLIVFAENRNEARRIAHADDWNEDDEWIEICAKRAPEFDQYAGEKAEVFLFCENADKYRKHGFFCITAGECDLKEECCMKGEW